MITQSQWYELVKVCPGIEQYGGYLKKRDQIVPDKVTYPQEQVDNKIEEARKKLQEFGIEGNKMCCLVFLALLGLTPADEWKDSKNESWTLSNGIMRFVSDNYNIEYKANTRESFRREGINVLLNNNLIVLNPDNPNLGPTSPNTHYAIRLGILNKIKES